MLRDLQQSPLLTLDSWSLWVRPSPGYLPSPRKSVGCPLLPIERTPACSEQSEKVGGCLFTVTRLVLAREDLCGMNGLRRGDFTQCPPLVSAAVRGSASEKRFLGPPEQDPGTLVAGSYLHQCWAVGVHILPV